MENILLIDALSVTLLSICI